MRKFDFLNCLGNIKKKNLELSIRNEFRIIDKK